MDTTLKCSFCEHRGHSESLVAETEERRQDLHGWGQPRSQGVISTPDNQLRRKCPSGFPGITCAVGMYYKSGQWHLQNLLSLQLHFQ